MRRWYAVLFAGGALGMLTAGWQTLERIDWAADHGTKSVCDLSATVSCDAVFSHWQSHALGVPNSVLALAVFAFLAAAGLAGLLGSTLSWTYLRVVLGLSVFMTAFVTWYMEQTAFEIGVLCLFCAGCGVNIVIAGIGATRVAAAHERAGRQLRLLVDAGADLVAWVGLALVVALMLYLRIIH